VRIAAEVTPASPVANFRAFELLNEFCSAELGPTLLLGVLVRNSNHDPLDLIERDLVAGAIVELRRARAFVRRHQLSILQGPAVVEIGGNPGGAERVAANIPTHSRLARAPLNHLPHMDARHRIFGELIGTAAGRAEEGRLLRFKDAGRLQIGIKIAFQVMMARHFMALAAFFMQAHPPAFAGGIVILDPHRYDGAHARETVGHDADERPIAQTNQRRDIDAVEEQRTLRFNGFTQAELSF